MPSTSSVWLSATSSDPDRAGRAGTGRRRLSGVVACALGCLLAAVAATPAGARVYLSVDEALDLAFPGCKVERSTVYLDDGELERARDLAGVDVERAIVHPYAARCPQRGARGERAAVAAGTAYFDTHRVRTLPETVMVVVDRAGKVVRVEVLAFKEPPDYLPREIWYDQFDGEALTDDLELKREIRPVTGATLTARATTDAVRRVLALHQVIAERPESSSSSGDAAR